ncbi:inositol monophosphatase family protein [Halapricum desulfuricans]|nr:inositol monophosphatase [Halapricum desulfuricans]
MDTRELAAVTVASTGAAVAAEHFRTDLDVASKSSQVDPVTEADRRTQRRIVSMIESAFPDDAIVAEEADARKTLPERGTAWIVDPIDGTLNYSRGMSEWVTSVAVVEDGSPVAGINVAPALDERYVATGDSVERDATLLSVSETDDSAGALVASTLRLDTEDHRTFGRIADATIEHLGEFRRIGSAQLTLSLVAGGAFDAAIGFNPDPDPWDTVAGVFQVRQAGGTVTDRRGERWNRDSSGFVASNGRLHEEALAVARETLE